MKISLVGKAFNTFFPFLRLEFLGSSNAQKGRRKRGAVPDPETTLGDYEIQAPGEVIVLSPKTTVQELENKFIEVYGLSVAVLRKSGKFWLRTTRTNHWTLEEQNRVGEILCNDEEFGYRGEGTDTYTSEKEV